MNHISDYNEFLPLDEGKTTGAVGGDFDHFGKIVKPLMDKAGFKWVQEKYPPTIPSGYADGYYCFPDHNSGINLFLDKSYTDPWKYVVFVGSGKPSNLKEFQWGKNYGDEKKAAKAAAEYAIQLKEKKYPGK